MFCQDVIHADMEHLKNTPTRNAHLDSFKEGENVEFDPTGEHGRIEEAFGACIMSNPVVRLILIVLLLLGYYET